MGRAVHGFTGHGFVFTVDDEHIIPVMVPVTGALPQRRAQNPRRGHLLIPAGLLQPSREVLQETVEYPSLRMPEEESGCLFPKREQIQLTAQFAMIPFGGLFQLMKIGVQFAFLRPSSPVDSLQHNALGIAAPVGTRH